MRLLGAVSVAAMAIGLAPLTPASAAVEDVCPVEGQTNPFIDVSDSVHEDNINCAEAYQLVEGTTPTTYNPEGSLTRGQAASILVNYVEVSTGEDLSMASTDYFTDDDESVHEENIGKAAENDILSGYDDGTFRPTENITRAQFASIMVQATEFVLGEELAGDGTNDFDDDNGNVHESNIEKGVDNELFVGTGPRTFSPSALITRGQTATIIINAIGNVLFPAGAFAPGGQAPGQPNQDLTDAPELLSVTRSGDIVTFVFDQNVPGKALDFFNTLGVAGSLGVGDEVSYYTGLRLYDVGGTAYYAQEAGIFGNEVRARFQNASVVAGAARAGVYEGTVQNAAGFSNPASDFPLQATAVAPAPITAYFPQLTFVGNLRTTAVTPAEILVDYTVTFANATAASGALTAIGGFLGTPGNSEALADEFALVGSAGQIFRGEDIEGATQAGANITVTVEMDPAIEDVPVSELRRGFIEEDAFGPAGLDHLLLSQAYQAIAEVNGTTTDPDLRAVVRGQGANQVDFMFDEAVSVPDGLLDNPDLYTVTNNAEDRATPSSIGRSLRPADGAMVMVATFTMADIPAGYATVTAYLNTVTAASVDVFWADADRMVVAAGAARGTDQVGSQQLGWSTPAQVLVTPVQPVVPPNPTPGATALPDLLSVTKAQNAITGNWRVTFTFDGSAVDVGTDVDFSLYDEAGVRFSFASRDIDFDAVGVVGGQRVFTFGPDVQGGTSTFSNEQIAAAVLGTVQDADADLIDSGSFGSFEPRITEGHDPIG